MKKDRKGRGINSLSAGIFLVIAISILLLLSLSVSVASAEGTYFEVDKQITPENILFGSAGDITIKISISVPEKINIDVIFAIDSSGSMRYSDPDGIRIECVKNFIDKMDISSDRAGLVSWDHNVDFSIAPTSNFSEVKKSVEEVNAEGGTNLDAGLSESVNLLRSNPRGNAEPIIIFLTDGMGDYTPAEEPDSALKGAIEGGYRIYTVGLGDKIDEDTLKEIANVTGGRYIHAADAYALTEVFEEIRRDITEISAPKEVILTDVLPDYLTPMNFSVLPDSQRTNDDGTTTLRWKIGDMKLGEVWDVYLDVKCNPSELSMDAYAHDDSKVEFRDHEGLKREKLVPNRKVSISEDISEEKEGGGRLAGEAVKVAGYGGGGLAGGSALTYYLLKRKYFFRAR